MDAIWMSWREAFDGHEFIGRKKLTLNRLIHGIHMWASRKVLHVLVVDNDRDSADALVRLVHRGGHEPYLACDGIAALRTAAAGHPNVVLLDLDVPLMDGRQIARCLRRDFPRNKCFIIALMERGDEESRKQCLAAGIDLILIKPIDLEVVETLLMLEHERVSRSRASHGLATKVTSRFACRKSSAEKWDRAAINAGMWLAMQTARSRWSRHETGGPSC